MPYTLKLKKRGCIEDETQAEKYSDFLGHPLTKTELRLIPYVQYCAVNQQAIDPMRVDADEISLLKDWAINGWYRGFPLSTEAMDEKCVVSKEFWNFMCDALFDFYVVEFETSTEGKS